MRKLLSILAVVGGVLFASDSAAQVAATTVFVDAPYNVGVRPTFTTYSGTATAASNTITLEVPNSAAVNSFNLDARTSAGVGKAVTATISAGVITVQGTASGDILTVFAPLNY